MEEDNKMDQQADRGNRDQETDKKPTQGSQDINRQQQGQQGQQGQDQRDQGDQREKKRA